MRLIRQMCGVLLLLLAARPAMAQQEAARELEGVAAFEDARAVATAPGGWLYVVDAGRNVVVQLTPAGRAVRTLGGGGSTPGAFYEPTDVDPTNGLVLVVADAGNARIQRFSREFVLLEVLPVDRVDRYVPGQAGQPIYSLDERGEAGRPEGRPIAVVTSTADEMFAVDATQGIVLKWGRQRRLERAIGGYDAGAGALIDPVGLAIDEQFLYVADRAEAGVAVFDHLGTFVRWIARGQAEDVQAATVAGGRLWIVLPDRLLVYTTAGRREREIPVAAEEDLVDVAPVGEVIYVLTARRLGVLRGQRPGE